MTKININSYMNYLIHNCYEEDYDPLFAEFWYDNYGYTFSFSEWYFLFRKKLAIKININLHLANFLSAPTFIYNLTNKLYYLIFNLKK
jgi:hypothetical protein